jgi:AcrR family transcriptional regulator
MAMSSPLIEIVRQKAESAGTRCLILQIAERLFREIGYRKTTVADIARELRMSPANVYRFFHSKGAINEAVAERLIGELEAELQAIVDRDAPAAERLAEFLRSAHLLSAGRFTTERRMHEMVEVAMAESWGVVHDHLGRVHEMLKRIVGEGVAAGEFDVPDVVIAARCVQTAFIRFCHPALIVQCADEPGPGLDEMIAFLLRGLGTG